MWVYGEFEEGGVGGSEAKLSLAVDFEKSRERKGAVEPYELGPAEIVSRGLLSRPAANA
jgi:hypothetical protein